MSSHGQTALIHGHELRRRGHVPSRVLAWSAGRLRMHLVSLLVIIRRRKVGLRIAALCLWFCCGVLRVAFSFVVSHQLFGRRQVSDQVRPSGCWEHVLVPRQCGSPGSSPCRTRRARATIAAGPTTAHPLLCLHLRRRMRVRDGVAVVPTDIWLLCCGCVKAARPIGTLSSLLRMEACTCSMWCGIPRVRRAAK